MENIDGRYPKSDTIVGIWVPDVAGEIGPGTLERRDSRNQPFQKFEVDRFGNVREGQLTEITRSETIGGTGFKGELSSWFMQIVGYDPQIVLSQGAGKNESCATMHFTRTGKLISDPSELIKRLSV